MGRCAPMSWNVRCHTGDSAMNLETKWELWLKTATLCGALVAAMWTLYVYSDSKQKEFYSSFWNKKMELYVGVSEAASTLATTESADEFVKARAAFWGYYYGRLSIVEDETVKVAMQVFAKEFPADGKPNKLPLNKGQQAYRLAVALKLDLLRSWQKPFHELAETK
jgi:hypothetical protein